MADQFRLKIITPERVFTDEYATMVEFNTTEGEIGVYAGHVPLTVIVKPGVLTITTAEGSKNAALLGGFAEILQDGVTIMAEAVEWPEEIDKKRAEDARDRARGRLQEHSADLDLLRAEAALLRALARLEVVD